MTRALALLLATSLLAACQTPPSPPAAPPARSTTATASLRDSVRAFGEAWAAHDMKTLDALLAPEYVHTDVGGRVLRRAEWLAYAQSQQQGSNVTFRDVEISEHGTFGIVLGANDITGGSLGTSTIRFTQVWRLADDGWKRVAFQATFVQAPR